MKIACWDIESSNLQANIGYIICASIKWVGEDEVQTFRVDEYKDFKRDATNDRRVVKDLAEALTEADMWVTWYGERFDLPFVQTRLLAHKLDPLPRVPHVDGWKIARNRLKLNSNRLATVCSFLELPEKTQLSWESWRRAAAGHKKSIQYIVEHCEQDVIVLEEAYMKLKAFWSPHPNVSVMVNNHTDGCPRCGSTQMQSRGYTLAQTYRRPRYQCQKCRSWSAGKPERIEGIKRIRA